MRVIVLTISLAVAAVFIAVLLMGVKALFVRGGRFPNSHVCGNAELNRRINGDAPRRRHVKDY